ncbi:histidine kinase [Micromonospora cathayae]|uniref:histidine kinase n=1 Tax=Micromonospora cathayae TaxID=3028804 RepID=A0ABY8A037_9ACTN|nr:histidine kinase [Micromonospora sp. HUAS 3]WDZ87687.1 histidine kinase [Micromonospora sp. HUAS 3]
MRALGERIDGGWRRLLGDGLLGLFLAAPFGYARLTPPYHRYTVPLLVGWLLLLGAATVLAWRRPLAALVLVVLGSYVDGNFVFAIPVFSYLVGRRAVRALPAALVFAAIAAGGTVLNLGLLGTRARTWFLLATILIFGGVLPWLVGRYRRQYHALLRAGWEYAEVVRREQQGAAERVMLRERARIAREMHDSLGHDLSLIALRAGALELAADLDPRYRTAAGELRVSVTAATERLSGIVRVLRPDAGPVPVEPADVTALVDGARRAGMTVLVRGDPGDADLPELTVVALRGLVREALTNAARYAPGARVVLTVRRVPGRFTVSVVNGPGPTGPPVPVSTGSGLLALGERVRLAGGTLAAGPEGTGFAVRAHLPGGTGDPGREGDSTVPDPTPALASARSPAPTPDRSPAGSPAPTPDRSPAGSPALTPDRPSPWDGSPGAGPPERFGAARRRLRRSLLVAVGTPVALAGLLALVYHPYVTADAVLDPAAYERMRPGQPRADLAGLPRRQVEPPADAPAGCEYYTDGNFPLAQPTWRLCFRQGRLVGKERID